MPGAVAKSLEAPPGHDVDDGSDGRNAAAEEGLGCRPGDERDDVGDRPADGAEEQLFAAGDGFCPGGEGDRGRAVLNVHNYRKALLESPSIEMRSMLNALDGGYTAPSPGGDPVAIPNTLPPDATFSRSTPRRPRPAVPGKRVWPWPRTPCGSTVSGIATHCPARSAIPSGSSEFIETEGATIAQIFYMLGVEPVYDSFGRVTDIRLIPSEKLGRPRIDVVVQTSGQLRDIAALSSFPDRQGCPYGSGGQGRRICEQCGRGHPGDRADTYREGSDSGGCPADVLLQGLRRG